jgi:hypothetical protein
MRSPFKKSRLNGQKGIRMSVAIQPDNYTSAFAVRQQPFEAPSFAFSDKRGLVRSTYRTARAMASYGRESRFVVLEFTGTGLFETFRGRFMRFEFLFRHGLSSPMK